MAGRRGGGNGWHDLWSMIVALILLGVLMTGLVSSGGWRVLSGRLGIGNPDAHTSDLTKDRGAWNATRTRGTSRSSSRG